MFTSFILLVKALKSAMTRKSRRLTKKYRYHLTVFRVFIVGTFLSVICLTFLWVMFDSFTFYFYFLNLKNQASEGVDSGLSSWGSSPSINESDKAIYGQSGLESMYANVTGGTYYKEYLEIIRDTCNGSLIQDGHFEANTNNFPDGKESWTSVPIFAAIGMNLAETGTNSDGFSPAQYLDVENYDPQNGYSLSNYNTGFILDEGLEELDNGFQLDAKKVPGGSFRGPYQFGQRFFDVFAVRSSDWSSNNAIFWPSSLNGYGFETNDIRKGKSTGGATDGQLDALYLPDVVAALCEYAHYNLGGSGRNSVLPMSVDAFSVGMAAMHSYGEAGMSRYHLGVSLSLSEKRPYAISAWEETAELFAAARPYVYQNADSIDVSWFTQKTWMGWATTIMLLDDGIVRDQHSLNSLKNYMSNPNFVKGSLLAYRYMVDNNATEETVKNFYNGLTVTQLNDSIYGASTIYLEYKIYSKSDSLTATVDGQTIPIYYYWDSQALYEAGCQYIVGPYSYWKMLIASGVECTLEECAADVYGSLISEIVLVQSPVISDSNLPANSYYYGTRPFISYVPGSTELYRQSSVMYWRTLNISYGIHFGEDFAYPANNLAAIAAGKVIASGYDAGGWGNYVQVEIERLEGEPKMVYTYAHMSSVKVKQGDIIQEGDIIGVCGTTGNSTGVHLHLELWVYLEVNGETLRTCMSYGSIYEGLYTPATGPRVFKKASGAKSDPDACIVYSGTGEPLGVLSEVNKEDLPDWCVTEPIEHAGINYFMNAALQSYGMVNASSSATA